MSTSARTQAMTLALGAVLWISAAVAGDKTAGASAGNSAVRPGDDALTCDQIYAQGMAESQRDQEDRRRRNEQQKAELQGLAALAVTADTAGQLDPSHTAARAAQKTAEAQADQQLARLGAAPQSNPRLGHLKELWTQKHCVTK